MSNDSASDEADKSREIMFDRAVQYAKFQSEHY